MVLARQGLWLHPADGADADIFVHAEQLDEGDELKKDQRVRFTIAERRGKVRAEGVKLL